jgi:glycosyltransferase involved in cell wall biosynthesis
MATRTLYLCYFGLREPLVQTQVLPYLRQLVAGGIESHLLTFEPKPAQSWTGDDLERLRALLAAQGIRWVWLPYHKSPSLPATVYDILAGARRAVQLIREHEIDIVHARSHVAAAMGAAAKRLTGRPFVFDIRGFLPEEYVDAGVWSSGGFIYRLAKAAERHMLAEADGFVVLTEKARHILFGSRPDASPTPIEVIPCCVDLRRFEQADGESRTRLRGELGLAERRVIAYVGALGGRYMTEQMADFVAAARRRDATTFAMILAQSPPEMMKSLLRARGVSADDFLVRAVSQGEVPEYLSAADVALLFLKPGYAAHATSPTKFAEYLAAGLPVVCNAGIGDVDDLVEGDRIGVVLREFTATAYDDALDAVERLRVECEALARRCRHAAARGFDLEKVGGERYLRLYRRVLRVGEGPALVRKEKCGA